MQEEGPDNADAHVANLLALYHLDVLDRRREQSVGWHLKSCGECRAAAVEVCETLAALALLADDRDELLNAYGALGTAVPPSFPARFAPQEPPPAPQGLTRRLNLAQQTRRFGLSKPAPAEPPAIPSSPRVVAAAELPGSAPVASAAKLPARAQKSGGDLRRPGRPGRGLASRRTIALARLGGLLVIAVALAVISANALLATRDDGSSTAAVLTAAATASDSATGADLSVFVTEQGGAVAVRATLNGLHADVGYRLHGHTFDGLQRPVVNWTGRSGVQEVTGELPVGMADVSHFTVSRGTRVVVTAYLPRQATSAGRTKSMGGPSGAVGRS
jgi:hypothetical protein